MPRWGSGPFERPHISGDLGRSRSEIRAAKNRRSQSRMHSARQVRAAGRRGMLWQPPWKEVWEGQLYEVAPLTSAGQGNGATAAPARRELSRGAKSGDGGVETRERGSRAVKVKATSSGNVSREGKSAGQNQQPAKLNKHRISSCRRPSKRPVRKQLCCFLVYAWMRQRRCCERGSRRHVTCQKPLPNSGALTRTSFFIAARRLHAIAPTLMVVASMNLRALAPVPGVWRGLSCASRASPASLLLGGPMPSLDFALRRRTRPLRCWLRRVALSLRRSRGSRMGNPEGRGFRLGLGCLPFCCFRGHVFALGHG